MKEDELFLEKVSSLAPIVVVVGGIVVFVIKNKQFISNNILNNYLQKAGEKLIE